MSSRAFRTMGTVLLGACVVASLFLVLPAEAQSCGFSSEHTPARPVDERLWGPLEPLEYPLISSERDTTSFDRNRAYSTRDPLYRSVEIEDGRLFAGFNMGVKIWDIDGASGTLSNGKTLTLSGVPLVNFNPHDYFRVKDVDVSEDGELMAMTGHGAMGMTLWRVGDGKGNPTNPRLLYQDGHTNGKYGEDVYITKINGVRYGYLASWKSSEVRGLHSYNLDVAAALGNLNSCVEIWPTDVNCTGAHLARMTDVDTAHVDGTGNDQTGHFLVSSTGKLGSSGLSFWNISQPNSPKLLFSDLNGKQVQGLAMWTRNNRMYLALTVRGPDEAQIYDMTCLRTASCGGQLPNPIYTFPITGWKTSSWPMVNYSESNGTPYLYIGQKFVSNIDVLQAEWLLDVTDPSNPLDVLGGDLQNGGQGQPTIVEGGVEVGYWSWYYSCNPSGSNWIEPGGGMVHNGYFYRSATGILDIHKVGETKPRVLVQGTKIQGYEGEALRFTAQALNCQPSANGWSWSATGGGQTASTSAIANVTWAQSGDWEVSATNSGCPGAEIEIADIEVLDAEPFIAALAADVIDVLSCSPVTFTASGVTGRAPLTDQWEILDASGQPLVSPTLDIAADGLSAVWDTSADQPADGTYRARLTLSNGTVDAAKTSIGTAVTNPGALGFNAPIDAEVTFGTVDFQSHATGATEWRWTFGDGQILQTTNPVAGPAPEHNYEAIGTYDVTVEVRNCFDTGWVQSATKQVEILEVNPLTIHSFQAKSIFGYFFFDTGVDILFNAQVEGDPDSWDYDWDGNGVFEDVGNTTEVTKHAYSQAGNYRPILRITRGNASKTFQHNQVLEVSSANRSISISGARSGKTGNALSFSATATGCTPASTGWSWTASGGGNIASGGSSVSIIWNSTGSKVVTATNSACGTASDTHTVSITSSTTTPPPPPPPTPANLNAAFKVTPAVPDVGELVTFDASSSSGSPSNYSWEIGGTSYTGKVVQHTFTEAGSFGATLEVGKAGSGCSFNFCTDEASKNVQVLSTGPVVGANGCLGDAADDAGKLCLKEGRFEVEVDWRDHHNGNRTGIGGAKAYEGSGVTGFFWFFNPNNVDLIIKILETAAGDHWVFYGGLSDVYYKMTVTDTETNQSKSYENLEGSICGKADTSAFPADGGGEVENLQAGTKSALFFPASGSEVSVATDAAFRPGDPSEEPEEPEAEPSDTLSLLSDRFEVTVDWVNQHAGDTTGIGTAVPGTNQAGYFWFFNERNLEIVVKMVDGRAVNGYWWVFYGGLSDTNYTIKVVDTITGEEWTRTNAPGNFCGAGDTAAFAAD